MKVVVYTEEVVNKILNTMSELSKLGINKLTPEGMSALCHVITFMQKSGVVQEIEQEVPEAPPEETDA